MAKFTFMSVVKAYCAGGIGAVVEVTSKAIAQKVEQKIQEAKPVTVVIEPESPVVYEIMGPPLPTPAQLKEQAKRLSALRKDIGRWNKPYYRHIG